MTRCRIFVCLTCKRVIAGCGCPSAVVEPIDSCAVCASARSSARKPQ